MFLSYNNENYPQMLYKEKYFPNYPRKNTNLALIFSCNFLQFRGLKNYPQKHQSDTNLFVQFRAISWTEKLSTKKHQSDTNLFVQFHAISWTEKLSTKKTLIWH